MQTLLNWLTDPTVFRVNRLDAHSDHVWDGHAELRPPEIDWEHCPVGSYVREFDLDPGLRGKQVCISFQGAE